MGQLATEPAVTGQSATEAAATTGLSATDTAADEQSATGRAGTAPPASEPGLPGAQAATPPPFSVLHVAAAPEVTAPDGSAVRVLVQTARGSMARFSLPGFAVSRAVCHRSVSELWYVLAGNGRMWLRCGASERLIDLMPGVSLAIEAGTQFQFRNMSAESLHVLGMTMPPWPGEQEASISWGPWISTL